MKAFVISKTTNSPYGLQTIVWPHSYGTYGMAKDELTKHLKLNKDVYKCERWSWDEEIKGTLISVISVKSQHINEFEEEIVFRVHTTTFVIGMI